MRKKFRETLWFKKGVEAEAAHDQAVTAPDDEVTTVHELPVEDRYCEDGSLRPSDSQLFGLHTGTTQAMQPIDLVRLMHAGGSDTGSAGVPEHALIAEMKRGRRMVFAMIAVVMLAVGGVAMTLV